jgi:hypothetical protein
MDGTGELLGLQHRSPFIHIKSLGEIPIITNTRCTLNCTCNRSLYHVLIHSNEALEK